MGYSENLLSPGETIQKTMRPHFRALIVPSLILILIVIGIVFLARFFDSMGWHIDKYLYIFAAILVVFFVVPKVIRWATTLYVFTTRRIIVRRGLIARNGREIPLSKINSVSFDQTVMGRILNYGTLNVESANVDGEVFIEDVPNVQEIQQMVSTLMDADDQRRRLQGHPESDV